MAVTAPGRGKGLAREMRNEQKEASLLGSRGRENFNDEGKQIVYLIRP